MKMDFSYDDIEAIGFNAIPILGREGASMRTSSGRGTSAQGKSPHYGVLHLDRTCSVLKMLGHNPRYLFCTFYCIAARARLKIEPSRPFIFNGLFCTKEHYTQ